MTVTCDFTLHPDVAADTIHPVIYKDNNVFSNRKMVRISAASTDKSGDYRCAVTNSGGTIVKHSKTLSSMVEELVVGAKISVDEQDPDMFSGNNITFTCSIRKGTFLSYTWLHNDKEIGKNCELYDIRQDGRVLYIEALQQEHSGVYRCNVSNHLSYGMSDELKITVIEPVGALLLLIDKEDVDLMPDDGFTFTCSLVGDNSFHFFWIHNEQNLKLNSSSYEFRDGGKVLHIKSAQPDHEGSYQCGVIKDTPSGRTLVSKSGVWILKISSTSDPYFMAFLMSVVVVALFIILFIVCVYKYQKIYKSQCLQEKTQHIRVPLENIEDKTLLEDNVVKSSQT
ncbi:cell adhesion molecule CEACAM2-like [Engystomops pustulosus]